MKQLSWACLIILLLISAAACPDASGSSPAPAVSGEKPVGDASKAPAGKPAVQDEWDRTVQAARQEGTVVLYTTLATGMRSFFAPPLKDKYGIDLEFVSGRTAEVMQKMTAERSAGLFMADISISGSSHSLLVKDAGFSQPLEPLIVFPEVKDPKLWMDGGLSFLDQDRQVLSFVSRPTSLLAYNTDLVKPPLQSFKELLDPKWKGKIVMNDPTISGSGGLFGTALGDLYGKDFLKALAQQDLLVTRDQRLQVEWVARGKYALALGPQTELVTEFIEAGAPLKFGNPADHVFTSAGTGYIAAVSKPAHPNATRVFVNWFLGKEGQTLFSKGMGVPSRRLDVPSDFIPEEKRLDPNKKYVNMETEEMARKRLEWQTLNKEIFGQLIK